MILHSHLLCVRTFVVKHELKIIVTVRNSHIDPAQNGAGGAASPELLETKTLAIEFHGRIERANRFVNVIIRDNLPDLRFTQKGSAQSS